MKELNFTILLFFLTSLTGFSQGYQGKRFALKIDAVGAILEGGPRVGLEYVLSRRFVVEANVSWTNNKFKQSALDLNKVYNTTFIREQEPGNIDDKQFSLIGKFYLNSSEPAPKGAYVFGRFSKGQAIVTGRYYDRFDLVEKMKTYETDGVETTRVGFGIGNQTILFRLITIDFDFGFVFGTLAPTPYFLEEDSQAKIQALRGTFGNEYGPNIYSFSRWHGAGAERMGGWGFAGHVKVGFLIF